MTSRMLLLTTILAMAGCAGTTGTPGGDDGGASDGGGEPRASCAGVDCGAGECDDTGDIATCDCDPGWIGERCERLIHTIASVRDPDAAFLVDVGDPVLIEGVVVAVDRYPGASDSPHRVGSFHIQDGQGPYSGIKVFNSGGDTVDVSSLEAGTSVRVQGLVGVFFDLLQIEVETLEVLPAALVEPAVTIVSTDEVMEGAANQEAYEGVLVRVEDVVVQSVAPQFASFTIDDGIRVENDYVLAPTLPDVGDELASITGILGYSFDDVDINPRTASDYVYGP